MSKRTKREVRFGQVIKYLGGHYHVIKMQLTSAGGTELTLREARPANFKEDYGKGLDLFHVRSEDGSYTSWVYIGEPIIRYLGRDESTISDYKKRGNYEKGAVFGSHTKYLVLDTRTGPRGGRQHLIQAIWPEGIEPPSWSRDEARPHWVRMTGMEKAFLGYADQS